MKRLLIYLSIIVVLFALLWGLNAYQTNTVNKASAADAERLYKTSPDKLHPETVKQLDDPEYQNIITRDELERKIADQEDFFVYFFSPICVYCQHSTEHVNDVMNEVGVPIHQYNVLEDQEAFNRYGFGGTPTVMYFEDGVRKDWHEGEISPGDNAMPLDQFKAWLEQYQPQ